MQGMKMNRTLTIILALLLALVAGCGDKIGQDKDEPTPEETTLTEVGQMAPDFTVQTLDGSTFSLSANRGKVVLVNWFATWCGPCKEEMPHLQTEVWEQFKGQDFAMVSIAREETLQVVQPFVAKYKVTWPFALDPDRKAYANYASAPGMEAKNTTLTSVSRRTWRSRATTRNSTPRSCAITTSR